MLSKLLSNIAAEKKAPADEALGDRDNNSSKEEKVRSSEQVFESLLQSLQNDGSSDKASQLLTLSGNSSAQEESKEGKNILGGSFTVTGTQEAGNGQQEQGDQNILKELQKELQTIKKELTGDGAGSSTEDEAKVKTEQASENTSKEGRSSENAGSGSKTVESGDDEAAENVKKADGEPQKGKENVQPTSDVSNKAARDGSVAKLQGEQVAKSEAKESQEKNPGKAGAENKKRNAGKQSKVLQKAPNQQRQSDMTTGQSTGGQTAKSELTEQQKKVMGLFSQKDSAANISTKGLEMKAVQNENGKKKSKEKGKLENSLRGLGKQSSEARNKLLSRLGIANNNTQKEAKPLNLQNFSGISIGNNSSELAEQKTSWEEQVTQVMDSSGEKESKGSSGSGSMRLGQMTVTNASLRRKILPGLTKSIKQAASAAKENAGNWQKHTFTLDDGKNIQLSVRESKGVVQIKMGSMNLDLSKFLQQNLQQIREHLRQEFGSDVDLQFENQQQGEGSEFSGNAEQSNQKRNYRNNFAGESLAAENTEELRAKAVRSFGYNQMEWTA